MITGSISPRLVVGREHSEVTTTHELLVFHTKQWIGGVQELRVKDNLQFTSLTPRRSIE